MDGTEMQLTARQWATIDAGMDNAAQMSIDSGLDAERQTAVRQAGGNQVPWVGESEEWPPGAQMIKVSLTTDQWRMVLSVLDEDDKVYEALGDIESRDLGKDAGQAVRRQLR